MNTRRLLTDGTSVTDHWIDVPLDWSANSGEQITVYAREFIAAEALRRGAQYVDQMPYLLFLQGGPGGKGSRPAQLSGWMAEAGKDYRIIMLDQRGTGLSTPLNRQSMAAFSGPLAQARYMRHFRADSIVADAEALRAQLGLTSWTVLGQSFGGFCTLTYLSLHPEGLARALISGGLPPLTGHAEQVYRYTYQKMAHRNVEHFARFPEDREALDAVAALVRGREFASDPVRLLDGSVLTVERLQLLGLTLGGNTKADSLHYVFQEAFTGPEQAELSDTFLTEVAQRISFADHPLYAVMHESIYGQPPAVADGRGNTGWAAQRVREEFPEFSAEADSPLLLGEMIFRGHLEQDPTLKCLVPTADALAEVSDWSALYDLDQLAANTVPAAAAVYTDDVFVPREISLKTAERVNHLSVYQTDSFHHDGIHEDGPAVFRELLSRTGS